MINFCRWFYLGLTKSANFIYKNFLFGIKCLIDPKKASGLTYKGKPLIPRMMIGFTLSVYFICVFLSSRWYVQKLKINHLTTDIIQTTKILQNEKEEEIEETEYVPENIDKYANISYLSVDFDDLIKKNSETVAWIKVNNTNANYSVVQTDDNSYYLKHDFNKKYNYAGWIFADYRDDFTFFGSNTIIYGHNMSNRSMFGSLAWCVKESWYTNEENHYIKLSTPNSNTVWKIFSIYIVNPEVYYLKTYFETKEAHQEFIDTLIGRSIYNFGEEVTTDDKILTLSTCTDDGRKRIAIHSKMIKAEYRD